ncbi:efflux RND transporter permease subunit [Limnoglobus roseus]|uniref:AcrB/AcrD/AcrF family protein n=1 Tax=Limnoglobus roseus TaxID=2598579 RepID=A0A5C1AAD8_9BACT|nr:efflux RND transporter permease subunit [Limnoglobus roseus]QEL14986.1 AcrB/AcrD/AcrF family protein [Limnoglobus roseus]
MLARFFVDRPIFAWVISIVIVMGGVAAGFTLPVAQYPEITPPSVVVTCAYPGASAKVVADSVAAPIEQQVNGVEKMLYMSSQSGNDGTYTLTVTFEIGTDSNIAQVLVQNRVALANPQLPQEVQRQGVTVKKRSPDILLVVSLFSPDDTPPESKRDQLYLSNYATIQVRDELSRLPGVGDVTIIGQQDYSMRAWLDPDKLQANGLSAGDVVKAVQEQNVQVAAGQIGQEPAPAGQAYQYTLTTLGRLVEPDQFANIIVKTGSPTDPAGDAAAGAAGPSANSSATLSQTSGGTAAAGARAVGPTATVRARPVVRLKDVVREDRPMEVVDDDGKPASKMYRGIELTAKTQDIRGTLNQGKTKPSAGLAVFQLPGSNALDTADAIRAKMEELKRKFPTGVDYVTRYDTTPFVRQSVAEVFHTLRDAVLLVALVVLLFLQDWRAMILPMIDVPVSLTGTFMVMYLAGFSLNNLTLFGLVLAIGIVVDDAIVVLENIERWVAKGLDARSATIKAMGEITGPIIAITLVLAAVFVPAAFIGGITGQFYRQFALTIATAMFISAVNALTLAPARAVAIFKGREHAPGREEKKDGEKDHQPAEALPWWGLGALIGFGIYSVVSQFFGEQIAFDARPWWQKALVVLASGVPGLAAGWFLIKPVNRGLAWFFGKFNKGFEWATNVYGKAVALLMRAALFVLAVYAGLIALTYLGVTHTPVGFIPSQDKGYILVNVQLPDAASVQRTSEVMRQVQDIAEKIPGVAGSVAYSGQSVLLGANAPNFGTMFITFDDFEKRKDDHKQYVLSILGQFNQAARQEVMDAQVLALPAPAVNGLGSAGGYKFVVQDRGDLGPDELQAATYALTKKITEAGGGQAFTQYKANVPQLYADVDRVKCKQLGVALADVFQTLQVYLGGLYTNDFNQFGRTWQVNLQADAAFRISPESVRNLRVRNDKGEMVPLGAVADIRDSFGPITVQRYNLYSSAAVNGALPPGMSTGDGIKLVERTAAETLSGQTQIEWTELTYLQIREGNSAIYAFIGGVLLVFFILAAQYESWTLPLAVLLVVPLCILSSVVGVRLAHQDINIFTQVGFLVLIGLAAKNAILIVEFARERRMEGATATEATLDAAKTRLRPIIMTSLAFILGVVPLVLASGAGAEMRFTLGVAVFAGMIGVTLFGILLTPVFYHTIEKWTAGEEPVVEKKAQEGKDGTEESNRHPGTPLSNDSGHSNQ